MKNFSNEELATITSALQNALDYVHQKETLTGQVSDLLGPLIPGDGNRLFTVGAWNRTPALESEIIEWLADVQDGEEDFRPRRVKTLMDGDRMVAIHAEHMIGDPLVGDGLQHPLSRVGGRLRRTQRAEHGQEVGRSNRPHCRVR